MKTTYSRVNITLPNRTLERIAKAVRPGGRSRLIDTAVTLYLSESNRTQLRTALKEEAIEFRKQNLQFAKDTLDLGDLWER